MDRLVEEPLTTSLRHLAVAWILLDVRNHPCIEDRLAIGGRIEATIEIEIRAFETQARQLGHPFQGLQPLGEQHRIRLIDRGHRQGSQHIPVVVDDRDDFLPFLVFVAGIADAIPAFFGHRVGAISMQNAEIELVVICQMSHTGDEGMLKRAVIRPPGEDFVDRRIVDFSLAVAGFEHG
jgi:hypothetical protein